MKLLIVTQKVDLDDPVLGFFHRWIEEFASACESVTVIALSVGRHDLPANVRIESLGKERGTSRVSQIVRFRRLQRSMKGEYDAAFVHMTPVWVVLGLLRWSAPVHLWYEAKGGGVMLRMALRAVGFVFSASNGGLPVASAKHVVTGHGIDVDRFTLGTGQRDAHLALTVGRITASKRLHVLAECMSRMGADVRLRIVGGPVTADDQAVLSSLRSDRIEIGALPHDEIISLLRSAGVFLHASHTGLDKAVLEAMACGCPVASSAPVFQSILPAACRCTDASMPEIAAKLLTLPPDERRALGEELRAIVERDHALPRLIRLLTQKMQTGA